MQKHKEVRLYLQAPAKINLYLHVLGKRSDGYHELETWMQKLDLSDKITIDILSDPKIYFSCSDSNLPSGGNNLAVKGAKLFLETAGLGEKVGLAIDLQKIIPVAAGLGGGSSDAGTILKGLNNHFNFPFSESELIQMGKSLGADVPFFAIEAQSVIASGIGEKMIEVEPLQDYTIILVNPGVNVSTAEIFRNFTLTRAEKNSTLTGSFKTELDKLHLMNLENDLETVTIDKLPVIYDIKEELEALGAVKALMTGSGATVFGLFKAGPGGRDIEIEKAVQNLRRKFGDKVYITH